MTTDQGGNRNRTGRRPGQSGTRSAILDAARARFADVGFDQASIRSIAAAAEVDPALVHHYFGTKQDLFLAALELPVDPEVVRAQIAAVPDDQLGETIVRVVVGVWDSPIGIHAIAAVRSLIAGHNEGLARTFLLDVVLRDVRTRVDRPAGTGTTRVVMAVTQMIGVLVARKILEIEPVVSMPIDTLAGLAGPTLQRYLTGDLDLPETGRPR
jgi:AcrR family transcriptional regulator